MNWKKILNIIFGILLILSLIFNGYEIYQYTHKRPPETIEIHLKDTITITKTDTCWREYIRYKTKTDTLIFYEHDSIIDTINIEIPIEHKQYDFNTQKDSLKINGTILYHGYKAEIDTINIGYNFDYTQELPKQRKWGLCWTVGIYGGYGIGFNKGQYYFSPEIGIGAAIGIGGLIK